MEASQRDCLEFKEILHVYSAASGQLINLDKSDVCFGRSVREVEKRYLADLLQVNLFSSHGKYLGLPSFVGRNKKEVFNGLCDKVWKRLKGWKRSLFSAAGKEVLIKAIIQAIPTYVMGSFKLPKKVIERMHGMAARFWWGSTEQQRKIHWCRWEMLCKPKTEGGLGFRNLHIFNQAMLGKQCWRFLRNPNSLCARVMRACYFPHGLLLDAKGGSRSSCVWRSLVWGKEILKLEVRWRIGDGNNTKVLDDPWIPRSGSFKIHDKPFLPRDLKVIDLKQVDGQWDEDMIRCLFNAEDASLILSLSCSDTQLEDKLLWHYSKNGENSVKSGYYVAMKTMDRPETSDADRTIGFWKAIWELRVPNKIKHFFWKLSHEWLPTNSSLFCRKVTTSRDCARCQDCREEDGFHVIWGCKSSRKYWKLTKLWPEIKMLRERDPLSVLNHFKQLFNKEDLELLTIIAWHIWYIRNKKLRGELDPKPGVFVDWCYRFWDYSCERTKNRGGHHSNREFARWENPPPGLLKVNVDAGCRKNEQGLCVAAVARDHEGRCVGTRTAVIKRPLAPTVAKLFAVKEGLALGADLNLGNYVVESDCQEIVSVLNRSKIYCSDFEAVVLEAKKMMNHSKCMGVNFVFREANELAHEVAKIALNQGVCVFRNREYPFDAGSMLVVPMPVPVTIM